jgi:hypothetical protein
MMSLAFAAVVALTLAGACHEATVDTSSAPEMQRVQQPQKIQPQVTSGTICTKVTPPQDYYDRPAECVEVSGPTTMSAGSSATFMCRGWGRTSPEFNDWYQVFDGRARTWWTDDQSTLSLSASSFPQATVTAVAPGSAAVNCTIDGVEGSLGVTVTGTRTLVSMVVTPNPVPALFPGLGTDVSTNFVDNYGQTNKMHPPVDEWQSDNTNVATVGDPYQYGKQVAHVTAIASADPNTNGIANVKARVGTIWSSTSPVTVKPAPRATTVTVSPASATINKGAGQAFTALVKDQYGNTMPGAVATWSSNPSVATVASTGNLTATATGVGGGQTTIQANVDPASGNATLTVLAPTTVTVSPSSATMCPTGNLGVTATVKDQNGGVWTGGTVAWSSSNTNVATATLNGSRTANVAAVGNGTATITATLDVSGPSTVTVGACLAPPTSCTLDYIPYPHYLHVQWVNGDASASTEVWLMQNAGSWQLIKTDSPGTTQEFHVVGPGLWDARVRHVKSGYPPSAYCNTNGKTVP